MNSHKTVFAIIFDNLSVALQYLALTVLYEIQCHAVGAFQVGSDPACGIVNYLCNI